KGKLSRPAPVRCNGLYDRPFTLAVSLRGEHGCLEVPEPGLVQKRQGGKTELDPQLEPGGVERPGRFQPNAPRRRRRPTVLGDYVGRPDHERRAANAEPRVGMARAPELEG